MTAVDPVFLTGWLRRDRGPWTVDDVEELFEGSHAELIDGLLIVTPPRGLSHQKLASQLNDQLKAAAPAGVTVVFAPYAVYRLPDTYLEPDLVVARDEDLAERGTTGVPLLVVEIRSPSTRRYDQTLKREQYADLGVPSYWLADPQSRTLTVLALQAGRYVEQARGTRLELTAPYPVVIDLAG